MRAIFSFNYNDIMFVIMCASKTWFDECLSCLYHILSLSSCISYHASILSWPLVFVFVFEIYKSSSHDSYPFTCFSFSP